jgi:hypothetical protein
MVEKPKVLYSDLSDRYKIWEKLRKLNLSSEAKDLVWLLSHRAINTLDILKKWEIRNTDKCPVCLTEVETNLHPIIQCSSNKEMWKLAVELAPQIEKCTAEELADLEFGCRKEEQYALTTIVTEAFLTGWHTRNEAIFKGKNKTEKGTQILFLHRLRVRLKTDQIRWGEKTFKEKWGNIPVYKIFAKIGKHQDGTKHSTHNIHRGLSPSRVPAAPMELKLLGEEGDPLQLHRTQTHLRTRPDERNDLNSGNTSTQTDWCYNGVNICSM